MLFSSLLFLFAFLPTVLVFNMLATKHLRNGLLIFFSLFFYAWGGVTDSLILMGSILLNHLIGTRILSQTGTAKKRWLQAGI
ncbi:MAG: MBOAT family protein, partial [Flavobacteriales bacterium]